MSICSFFNLFLAIIFASCASGQPTRGVKMANKAEVIEYIAKQYYPADTALLKPFWEFNDKVWVKDSFAIEEVRQLDIQENYKGVVTSQEYILCHYRFTDLRKGFVYEFGDFSDTALLIRKYTFGDSVKVFGGWGFNHNRISDGTSAILPDTLIDNITYKRVKVSRGTTDMPYTVLCYFRCDKKGTIFDLIPSLSKAVGCPLVKIYISSPVRKGLHLIHGVKFVADTLTENELKVFTAWEKYAAMNPVVK